MDFKQFYKTINFDIDNEIRTVFQATQGDTKSRGLLVDLIVGGVKTPVTTEEMTFFALKPDGTRVMTVGVKEGTGFRIDFTNQTFAVPGVLLCTLVLSGTNGEKIADKKFKMTVDSSLEDGAIISEDERGILDRAFDLAEDIVPRLESLDVPLLENLEQEIMSFKEDYATRLKGELGDEHIIRELPNGIKDEFNIEENKIIKRVSSKLPIPPVSSVIDNTYITRVIIPGTKFDNKADWESESSGWKNVVVYNKDGSVKETVPTTSYDNVSAIGKYYLHQNQGIYFIMPLGTTNVQANELLKETTITYELKTPINVPLPSTMTPNTQYLIKLLNNNKNSLDGLLISENEEWEAL